MNKPEKNSGKNFKNILSVIAGLLCFWLSVYNIHYQIGEVSINIPWSLIFPVLVSLAYGRKAAIITSLSGAALYQFLLWPSNGYANFLNIFIFTTFYFIVGYLSEYTNRKRINKKVALKVVIFSFGYAFLFFLTFRYLFNVFLSFNPPVWAKSSISHMSVNVLHSIVAKNLINYALIILFSDTLLKIPAIRKLFSLPVDETMKRNTWILITSVSGAFLIWFVFYLLDNLLSENNRLIKDYLSLSFMVIMWSSGFAAWILIRFSESRARAKNELKASREYLESVIKNVPSVVFRCLNDSERTMKLVSNQISRITGYDVDDFIDNSKRKFADLIHQDDREFIIDSIKQQLGEKGRFEIETRIVDKFEILHWIIAKGILQGDITDETCFIDGAILDITEKKNTEKELQKYKDHLERLVEERTSQLENTLNELKQTQTQLIQSEKMASLGVLTAGVAHEINNPLNFIQTGLYALEKNFNHKQNPEDLLKTAEFLISGMKKGVTRAADIVKTLNTFGKDSDSEKTTCNIHEIINSSLLILNHKLVDKCSINKNFTNKQFEFIGNQDSLHQVFINLIMNSIQAIKAKGVINISTILDENKELLKIVIVDNGEGIKGENLPKIFDPFFTTKAPGKGVGIGLSIVYKIIKEHKGTIAYESEPSRGTTVAIEFPVKLLP